jgi:hypothetical protein
MLAMPLVVMMKLIVPLEVGEELLVRCDEI